MDTHLFTMDWKQVKRFSSVCKCEKAALLGRSTLDAPANGRARTTAASLVPFG